MHSDFCECQVMQSSFRIPFVVTAALMLGVIAWMIWKWSLPVEWLVNGSVFRWQNKYVFPGDSAGGDSFNSGVSRMILLGIMLTVASVTVNFIAGGFSEFDRAWKRLAFRVLAMGLYLFPLAAFGVALVMVSRLTFDMGITPMRVAGFALSISFLAFVLWCIATVGQARYKQDDN